VCGTDLEHRGIYVAAYASSLPAYQTRLQRTFPLSGSLTGHLSNIEEKVPSKFPIRNGPDANFSLKINNLNYSFVFRKLEFFWGALSIFIELALLI
jgi:hypothetical protein